MSARCWCERFLTVMFLVGLTMAPARLQAQAATGSGAVAGVVLDPDAKPVANGPVIVRSDALHVTRTAATDQSGRFTVDNLPPGDYTIEVSAPSFATIRREGIHVGAGQTPELTFTLTLASPHCVSETPAVVPLSQTWYVKLAGPL